MKKVKINDELTPKITILINGGLITVSLIIMQNFLSSGILDVPMLISILSFVIGIPLLACYILFLQTQLNKGFVLISNLQKTIVYLQWLGVFATIVGIASTLWHVLWIAAILFLITSIVGLFFASSYHDQYDDFEKEERKKSQNQSQK